MEQIKLRNKQINSLEVRENVDVKLVRKEDGLYYVDKSRYTEPGITINIIEAMELINMSQSTLILQ